MRIDLNLQSGIMLRLYFIVLMGSILFSALYSTIAKKKLYGIISGKPSLTAVIV